MYNRSPVLLKGDPNLKARHFGRFVVVDNESSIVVVNRNRKQHVPTTAWRRRLLGTVFALTFFVVVVAYPLLPRRDLVDCCSSEPTSTASSWQTRVIGTASFSSPPSIVEVPKNDACFITVQMAANGDFLEALQDMGELGIRLPGFRYIVITNDDSLIAKDWEKVVVQLDRQRYTKVKTHVTYAKFMAWQIPALASCRIIFYMDCYYVPVNQPVVWEDLERRARASPGGLLAQLKPRHQSVLHILAILPQIQKDTQASVDRTMDWLISRPDFKNDTACLWTDFVAYDPTNTLYRAASTEFWALYSTEMLTARDQPLFSYMVDKWSLRPDYIQCVQPTRQKRQLPPERRPHVDVCFERRRQLCLLGGQSHTDPECRMLAADRRHQHILYNVTDPTKIDCTKKEGGHLMNVLDTFITNNILPP
jgi:hypothetical protein